MKNSKKPPINNWMKYTSMGFQMVVIIFLGVFGGIKLDEKFQGDFPVFTVCLSLFSVFVAIYTSVKDFLKKK